jgi:hypothetical protein
MRPVYWRRGSGHCTQKLVIFDFRSPIGLPISDFADSGMAANRNGTAFIRSLPMTTAGSPTRRVPRRAQNVTRPRHYVTCRPSDDVIRAAGRPVTQRRRYVTSAATRSTSGRLRLRSNSARFATWPLVALLLSPFPLPAEAVFGDVPTSSEADRRQYLARGLTGLVTCPAEADPPHSLIIWTRNELVLMMADDVEGGLVARIRVELDGVLVIESVNVEDSGLYCCTSYSPRDDTRLTYSVQVVVRGRPTQGTGQGEPRVRRHFGPWSFRS